MATKEQLMEHFKKEFNNVVSANIITDPNTKLSKGYGFVQFNSIYDANRAIDDMHGSILRGKPIKVSQSQKKKSNEKTAIGKSKDGQGYGGQTPFGNYLGGLGVQIAGAPPMYIPYGAVF